VAAVSIIGKSPGDPAIWSETTPDIPGFRCLITNLAKDKHVHQVRLQARRGSVAQMQCDERLFINGWHDQFHPND
jgi:hypothetical protein